MEAESDVDPSDHGSILPQPVDLGPDLVLRGVLGQGGTAIVYRAFHGILQREVAVKMSLVRGPVAAEAQSRLVREAHMCASIRDNHVPRIYSLDKLSDGTPYIVMEKVAGSPLTQLLGEGCVTTRLACEITRELLAALRAVHAAGIVHRDVKPSNLMIQLRPGAALKLRLLDFGVGKVVSGPDLAALTSRGELLGTPLYMAPEQILGQPVDARADLYAAGVVLYEMLTGRTPFHANSVGEVFAAVLRDEMTPLASLRPDLGEALLAVVARATAKKSAERFTTARAMQNDLEDALTALSDEQASTVAPPREPGLDVSPTVLWTRVPKVKRARPARPAPNPRAAAISLARTVRVVSPGRLAQRGTGATPRVGFRARRSQPPIARNAAT